VAFLASMVSPKVAAAAAQRALEVLAEDDPSMLAEADYLRGQAEEAAPNQAEEAGPEQAAEAGASPPGAAEVEEAEKAGREGDVASGRSPEGGEGVDGEKTRLEADGREGVGAAPGATLLSRETDHKT
jgi:hypothetical protein